MDDDRRQRFRFRIRTFLLVVAFVALTVIVVMQQVQIGRQRAQINQMRLLIDAGQKEKDQLTTIMRELRDALERNR
jgi:hypothetical protein